MIPIGTNLKLSKLPKATLAIVGINIIVFIAEAAMPAPDLGWVVKHFGYGPGNWYNPIALITSIFLHGDIYHISFNMLFFWIFGAPVEERVGFKNFLYFYFITGFSASIIQAGMEAVARPGSDVPCIGASGAISGIMALFLYRCFHSKLKMVIAPILLPRQVEIPVIPLIALWFLQNFLGGLISMRFNTGIGYWAHVGGFVCGIAIGRINRYGHEGLVEKWRLKILKKLEDGKGWQGVEKELKKLLKIAPDDYEVNHDLARLYIEAGETKAAETHYVKAVRSSLPKEPGAAGYILAEYMESIKKPLPIQTHLKAAEALCESGDVESGRKVLAPFIKDEGGEGPLFERALVHYIKMSRHLDDAEETFRAVGILMQKFPSTGYRQEVRRTLFTKPGEVIAPAQTVVGKEAERELKEEERAADVLGVIETLQRYFIDPELWAILLLLNIISPFFFPGIYRNASGPAILFIAAYVMTVMHRMGHIGDMVSSLFYFGRSNKEAAKEFETKKLLHDARMAEKGGRYKEAAELYEKLLAADAKDANLRFTLARLYHKRLEDHARARRHYKFLTQDLSENHPFHKDASEAIKSLSMNKV